MTTHRPSTSPPSPLPSSPPFSSLVLKTSKAERNDRYKLRVLDYMASPTPAEAKTGHTLQLTTAIPEPEAALLYIVLQFLEKRDKKCVNCVSLFDVGKKRLQLSTIMTMFFVPILSQFSFGRLDFTLKGMSKWCGSLNQAGRNNGLCLKFSECFFYELFSSQRKPVLLIITTLLLKLLFIIGRLTSPELCAHY